MKQVTLTITLTLQGPVISGSSDAGEFGIDLPFAKTADKQYYLPGSHIKGRLRESLQTIWSAVGISEPDLDDWLGKESSENSGDRPERGRLIFEDFVFKDKEESKETLHSGEESKECKVSLHPGEESKETLHSGIRTRIKMDSERGAVAKGAYLAIESPFESREEIEFQGKIHFFAQNGNEVKTIKNVIHKGLRWIPALGGQRSVGFGRLTGVVIEESVNKEISDKITSYSSCNALELKIFPQAPFCIAKPRKANNLFESDAIISGGAIKGCIANTLNHILGRSLNDAIDDSLPDPWTELGKHFSAIRFDHAFPTRKGISRQLHYPLSIVRAPKDADNETKRTYDVMLCDKPGLIHRKAPVFSIDWKGDDYVAVGKELGSPESPETMKTVLRVRTAMDSDTRRSKEGELFAYEMIQPDDCVWHSRVDLTKIEGSERAKVRSQLQTLLENFGIKYLGKTKAEAEIEINEAKDKQLPDPIDKYWIITLQTPALMLAPKTSLNDALIDSDILFNEYKEFWNEISGGSLGLIRFFAQQKLLGGYLHHRFQTDKPYNPFLLTSEQSVFLLESDDAEGVKKLLGNWLYQGLPLPKWAKDMYGESWQTCPFIPENGFGEIAVNMDCHTNTKYKPECYTEI